MQLYVRDRRSKVERSIKELKGFDHVAVHHERTKAVTPRLEAGDPVYWEEAENGR
jgi:hypothetical protein